MAKSVRPAKKKSSFIMKGITFTPEQVSDLKSISKMSGIPITAIVRLMVSQGIKDLDSYPGLSSKPE